MSLVTLVSQHSALIRIECLVSPEQRETQRTRLTSVRILRFAPIDRFARCPPTTFRMNEAWPHLIFVFPAHKLAVQSRLALHSVVRLPPAFDANFRFLAAVDGPLVCILEGLV